MQKQALVIGAALIDLIIFLDELPKQSDDLFAKEHTFAIGGCSYNVADILRKLDIEVDLFAPMGKGLFSHRLEELMREKGFEAMIHDDSRDIGCCICLVDKSGERSFISLKGLEKHYCRKWFDTISDRQYEAIYVGGYEIDSPGGASIVEYLRNQRDSSIYFAPASRLPYIDKELLPILLDEIRPIIHINESEAIDFTGTFDYQGAAKALFSRTGSPVLITLGNKGIYKYDGEHLQIGTLKHEVLNSTGAGDANIAAIIGMRLKGCDWPETLTYANKVSARIVTLPTATMSDQEFSEITPP